ncbi:hypothetical protein VTN77DRAFT_7818 [Rasamsonia byssochlamydoides]|uniref:uncharacterized protein n=1 Tax=Rasamsonia byssochlamydoides TaxID=89139 RepID=UPI0037447B3F
MDKVCFTSHLIYRVCVDAVYPRRNIRLSAKEIKGPLWLLTQALTFFRPSQIANCYCKNNDGPSEDIFYVELYCALRDLVPESWSCAHEAHDASQKKLDLLLTREGQKYTGYELKANKGSVAEFEGPINQSIGYVLEHGVDIYLVNFVSTHKKIDFDALSWPATEDGKSQVIIVHVLYNDDYAHYMIKCMGESVPVEALGDIPGK